MLRARGRAGHGGQGRCAVVSTRTRRCPGHGRWPYSRHRGAPRGSARPGPRPNAASGTEILPGYQDSNSGTGIFSVTTWSGSYARTIRANSAGGSPVTASCGTRMNPPPPQYSDATSSARITQLRQFASSGKRIATRGGRSASVAMLKVRSDIVTPESKRTVADRVHTGDSRRSESARRCVEASTSHDSEASVEQRGTAARTPHKRCSIRRCSGTSTTSRSSHTGPRLEPHVRPASTREKRFRHRANRGTRRVTLRNGGNVTNYATRSNDSGRYLQHGTQSARRDLVEEARRENREREARNQRELFYAARRAR